MPKRKGKSRCNGGDDNPDSPTLNSRYIQNISTRVMLPDGTRDVEQAGNIVMALRIGTGSLPTGPRRIPAQ